MLTKNEIFDLAINYNYRFAAVLILVFSKTNNNREECTNPL